MEHSMHKGGVGHISHTASDKHTGHQTETFLKKFWICLALTIPVVLYSELPEVLIGWTPPLFAGSSYVAAFFASIIFWYGGWVFLAGALRELRGRLPGMMTLIGIAITAAYLWSIFATFARGGEGTLYWELATLITIMLLGHYLEMKAVASTRGALKELAKLIPDTAEVIRGDKVERISISELKKGDIVLLRPGTNIPADGVVAEGESEVNEAIATGESKPVSKIIGARVIAGTTNGDGSLKIRVDKIGDETFLSGVMRLVREAEQSKSRLQILSDRAAMYLTGVAVTGGGATLVAWILSGAEPAFAVERMVAVLVIACPHALGLAVPLVASLSTQLAARRGFLVKRRIALESAREIDTVLFDKTGTLTTGAYGVDGIFPTHEVSGDELLLLASSVNAHSEHPIARALQSHLAVEKRKPLAFEKFERLPGKGVRGQVAGAEVISGSDAILADTNLRVPEEIRKQLAPEAARGKTIIHIVRAGVYLGAISLADQIRPESKEAVSALQRAGINVAMITGDSSEVAAWVAQELGVNEYFARVLPNEKSEKVKLLQSRGQKVAMVGDGVNDAPALAQADLGIAIGAGTNVAIESAGIILVKNDPRDIPAIIALSRATRRKMIQNLWWASGYNLAALPLAAGVLASQGILLNPAVGAVFMSLSTVIVALNALLLKRITL